MDAVQFNPVRNYEFSLRQSVVEIINSKIQKEDFELKKFLSKLHNPNQIAGRASDQDASWIEKQKRIFDVIELSSKYKTKLFYLRIRVTESNSAKVLHLITTSRLNELTLQELKEEIS